MFSGLIGRIRSAGRCWEPFAQTPIKVMIGFEKGVKANICSKLRPIVGADKVGVITMDNINVPAHESHLESQNGQVIAVVVGQDETDCIAICNPHKALPKQHVMVFVDSPVAGKPLSQVGIKVDFVPVTLLATK
jgi:hypothetical protein